MEYKTQAEEYSAPAREYDIPNEFPHSKPLKKKKKRSNMAAALLTSVMVLTVAFDYVLPFAAKDRPQTSKPGITGEAVTLACMPAFGTAAEALLAGDYVAAAVCMVEAATISYAEQEEQLINNVRLAYSDGQMYSFADQDLRDGSGVYFWIDMAWAGTRNDETGETYSYLNMNACAYYVTLLENDLMDFRAVKIDCQVDVEQTGEINFGYGDYFQAVMDAGWNADRASLEHFTFYPDDGYAPEENLIGSNEVSFWERTVGPLQEGNFCGEVQWWKDNVTLSADKTKFEYPDDSFGDYYKLLLDEQGKTLVYEMGLADLTGYEYYSEEYVALLLDVKNDPSIPGAIGIDDGEISLYLKKVNPDMGEINYGGSSLLDHAWFPVINTDLWHWFEFEDILEPSVHGK